MNMHVHLRFPCDVAHASRVHDALPLLAQTRLAAARAKAEAVVGQEDLSERGKAREIEKLYAKARAGKGAKKAKPSRSQQRHGKKGPPLDGRTRADKRQVCVGSLHSQQG